MHFNITAGGLCGSAAGPLQHCQQPGCGPDGAVPAACVCTGINGSWARDEIPDTTVGALLTP